MINQACDNFLYKDIFEVYYTRENNVDVLGRVWPAVQLLCVFYILVESGLIWQFEQGNCFIHSELLFVEKGSLCTVL